MDFTTLDAVCEQVDGAVIYTDGSATTMPANIPGPTGGGIHGYLYKDEPMKRGLGLGKFKAGKLGYTDDPADTLVSITDYFDVTCSFHYGTNNTAEQLAALEGINIAIHLAKKGIKKICLLSDSKYVLDGALKHLPKWAKNNWKKSNGDLVKNVDNWKKIHAALAVFTQLEDIDFSMQWVKGHMGEPGNEAADQNALLGKVLNIVRKTSKDNWVSVLKTKPQQGYWKVDDSNKVTLLRNQCLLFDVMQEADKDNDTFFGFTNVGEGTNDLSTFGMPDETASYSIIQVKNNTDTYLNEIMQTQHDSISDAMSDMIEGKLYAGVQVREAYSKKTLGVYNRFGKDVFIPKGELNELFTLNNKDNNICSLVYPVKMGMDGISIFQNLHPIFESFFDETLKKNDYYKIIDVTDLVYDVSETKKGKKVYKLKRELDYSSGKLDLCLKYPTLKEKHVLNPFVLSFGSDMPRREVISAAAKENPVVTVIYWVEGGSVSRVTAIDTDTARGVWFNPWRSVF